jgi:hypothetical protein
VYLLASTYKADDIAQVGGVWHEVFINLVANFGGYFEKAMDDRRFVHHEM